MAAALNAYNIDRHDNEGTLFDEVDHGNQRRSESGAARRSVAVEKGRNAEGCRDESGDAVSASRVPGRLIRGVRLVVSHGDRPAEDDAAEPGGDLRHHPSLG